MIEVKPLSNIFFGGEIGIDWARMPQKLIDKYGNEMNNRTSQSLILPFLCLPLNQSGNMKA
jgi:hypothetical protein